MNETEPITEQIIVKTLRSSFSSRLMLCKFEFCILSSESPLKLYFQIRLK